MLLVLFAVPVSITVFLALDHDGDGWTNYQEIVLYYTDPYTPNPNARYFVDKGGTVELLKKIGVLDADGKTDLQRREFIDYLFSPNLSKLPSSQLVQVRSKCIDQILKDGRVSIEEAAGLHLLSQYSGKTQATYSDFTEDVVKYLYTLTSQDRSFVDYAIQNKLRMEGSGLAGFALTDLDMKFLLEPDRYAREVLDADLRKLAAARPNLAAELKKLPDFEAIGVREIEANEDIVCRILRSSKDELNVFDIMLREGIPEKRKYCTPLQALIWHYVDNEPSTNNPLADPKFSSKSFVESVWVNSFTSGNFRSDRWKDFQTVRDRVNSVDLVDVFMRHNVRGTSVEGEIFQTAIMTFNRRDKNGFMLGDCEDHAMFAADFLANNGYEAYVIGVHPYTDRGDGGHAVTLFKYPETQSFFLFDNLYRVIPESGYILQRMGGPFNSYEDAASHVHIDPLVPWKRYAVFDIFWNIVKNVTR
jgi:hypothetical protein